MSGSPWAWSWPSWVSPSSATASSGLGQFTSLPLPRFPRLSNSAHLMQLLWWDAGIDTWKVFQHSAWPHDWALTTLPVTIVQEYRSAGRCRV